MLAALVARLSAALTSNRLRVEALRILLLLRERFYLRVISLGMKRLRTVLVPAEARAQEAALTSLTTAVRTHADAVNRLASALETLANAQTDDLSRPLVDRNAIAALAAATVAVAPSLDKLDLEHAVRQRDG